MYIVSVGYHSKGQIEALLDSIDSLAKIPVKVIIWDNGETRLAAEAWETSKKKCPHLSVKILGDGELTVALTVEAHKFSASAIEKIRKAGGEAKALEG